MTVAASRSLPSCCSAIRANVRPQVVRYLLATTLVQNLSNSHIDEVGQVIGRPVDGGFYVNMLPQLQLITTRSVFKTEPQKSGEAVPKIVAEAANACKKDEVGQGLRRCSRPGCMW